MSGRWLKQMEKNKRFSLEVMTYINSDWFSGDCETTLTTGCYSRLMWNKQWFQFLCKKKKNPQIRLFLVCIIIV